MIKITHNVRHDYCLVEYIKAHFNKKYVCELDASLHLLMNIKPKCMHDKLSAKLYDIKTNEAGKKM